MKLNNNHSSIILIFIIQPMYHPSDPCIPLHTVFSQVTTVKF